jgi:hypothetical protein
LSDALNRGLSRPDWLRPAVDGVREGVSLTHTKLLELTRDTKKTLYVVSAAYVGVGFILAVVCLATGQLLGTFLGFLIISGTLGAAAVLRAVLRIGVRVSAIAEGLDDIRRRLDRVEGVLQSFNTTGAGETETAVEPDVGLEEGPAYRGVMDVARARGVEPDAIMAATLDRGVFPRLVSLLEQESAPEEHDADESLQVTPGSESDPAVRAGRDNHVEAVERTDPAQDEQADESLHPVEGDPSALELEQLLRRSFADCVRRRDLTGLLEVTELVIVQLPDHPMAEECRRLQPRLREAVADGANGEGSDGDDAPSSRTFRARHVAHATP